MREETRKRLERAIWRERMKKVSVGVAIACVAALYAAYASLDLKVENVSVAGTIEAIDPLISKTNSADGLNVGVKLDDGRHIRVTAFKSREPHLGDHIQVVEHRHGTGRVTHTLK